LIKALGEREFALQLLAFDQEVEGELKQVLYLLLTTEEPASFQLALLWLDGKGWGQKLNWTELMNSRRKLNALISNNTAQKDLKSLLEEETGFHILRVTKHFPTAQSHPYSNGKRLANQEEEVVANNEFKRRITTNTRLNLAHLLQVQNKAIRQRKRRKEKLYPYCLKLLYLGLFVIVGGLAWFSLFLFSIGAPELGFPILGLALLIDFGGQHALKGKWPER
jgi:hypothetical protein